MKIRAEIVATFGAGAGCNREQLPVCTRMPRKRRGEEVAYCRRQAARCRRLARDTMHQNRDIAIRLEALAVEFEGRASQIEAEDSAPDHQQPKS